MKFAFLDDYRGALSRAHACRVMGVTDRGLRAWKHRPVSHRHRRDMVLLAHIREQHRLSQGSYGRPRMTEELNELGLRVGHRRVGRLMRQNAICVVRTHKFKATTDSDHIFNIAPNLLQQDFAASQPNQKGAGDITYIWTREGWVYLAVILDLHSRRVIGWAISNRMKKDLAIRALNMAIALRRPPKGCIHHTDRPSHGLKTNRCRATDGTYDTRKCRDARAIWGQSGCKPICAAKPHRRGAYRIACPSSKDLKFTVVEIVLPAYRHLDVPFSQILLIVARQHSASIRMMGAAWRWRSDRDRHTRGQVSHDLLGILEDCRGHGRLNRSSLTT